MTSCCKAMPQKEHNTNTPLTYRWHKICEEMHVKLKWSHTYHMMLFKGSSLKSIFWCNMTTYNAWYVISYVFSVIWPSFNQSSMCVCVDTASCSLSIGRASFLCRHVIDVNSCFMAVRTNIHNVFIWMSASLLDICWCCWCTWY